MKKGKIIIFVVVIVICGTSGWWISRNKKKEEKVLTNVLPETLTPLPVSVTLVRKGDLVQKVRTRGIVIAEKQSQILSKISGKIEKINIKEGKYVKKGSLLLVFDGHQEAVLSLKKAKANLKRQSLHISLLSKTKLLVMTRH
jgi:multidrug efflux pump subunit AcrA (membrane-fusion protein)